MTVNCTNAKLNPTGAVGATRISFPGFQKIADFTATGGETSLAVSVNGDTDLTYLIYARAFNDEVDVRLNNVSTASYGREVMQNVSGTIASSQATNFTELRVAQKLGVGTLSLSTPSGFIKIGNQFESIFSSGTTVSTNQLAGYAYNSTANITSLNFIAPSTSWGAGTKIVVYVRRS